MKRLNELNKKIQTEEEIITELNRIEQSMIENGIEVRAAIKILEAELNEGKIR